MKALSGLLAVAAFACSMAASRDAVAQDYLGAHIEAHAETRLLENMQDNAAVGDRKRAEAKRREGATSAPRAERPQARQRGKGAVPDLSRFDFKPSTGVTRRVNEAVAGVLSGRHEPDASQATARALSATFTGHPRFRTLLAAQLGGRHDRILQSLESGVLQDRFSGRLGRYGYSATNAIDVNNAYLIHASGLVNNARTDGRRAYDAQRAKSGRALSAGVGIARASDAAKQEFAETIGLLVMLSGAAWNTAGSAADKAALQAGSADMARRLGMDLGATPLAGRGGTSR